MKHALIVIIHVAIVLSLCVVAMTGCNSDTGNEKADPVVLNTFEEKVSYALGQDHAANLKRMGGNIDPDLLARGLMDALKGVDPALPPDEMRTVLASYRQQLMSRTQIDRAELAAKNLEEGQKFLTENKTKPGVQTTASGLQYKVLEEGEGPSPSASNRVSIHYEGTLLDGSVFDNSYRRGKSSIFLVSNLVDGWEEALQMMKVGSKWEIYIPPDLAYGERGSGPMIGPHALLIINMELVDIVD